MLKFLTLLVMILALVLSSSVIYLWYSYPEIDNSIATIVVAEEKAIAAIIEQPKINQFSMIIGEEIPQKTTEAKEIKVRPNYGQKTRLSQATLQWG